LGRVAPYLGRVLLRLPRRWRHALVWEVARGVLRAWHDHDVDTLIAVYHQDAVIDMENWSDWLDRSTYRGAEGVRQFFADFDAAWTEFSFHPTRQLELSRERYLVEIEFEGTGASSGIQVRRRFFQIAEARNGRFTHMANYTDEGDAFEAAGLHR
jgi:ketosteroid isomerase-like protein